VHAYNSGNTTVTRVNHTPRLRVNGLGGELGESFCKHFPATEAARALCYQGARLVRRTVPITLVALAASLLVASPAASRPTWAGQCGIPASRTVWADYSWSTLLPVMARPGTVLALTNGNSSTDYSAQARSLGAATYSFDIVLKRKVGTPDAPADPATIAAAAQAQYDAAVDRSGGCTSPLIVENELFGAATVTPWSASTAQYRSDVLAYLQDLAQLGAHPVLLLARPAYLGSPEAAAWWLQVAQVADIVREQYVPAPAVWKLGPVLGNRLLRERYRSAVGQFLSIGVPASRLGIMVSVLSQKGGGGRSGLQPASAWLQVVKWYALSAKEVAGELGLGSVFSWGWQQWNPQEVDPTKEAAACVWLWARKASLCNAPQTLGRSFDGSRTAGQISLPAGTVCTVPGYGTIGATALARLATVTGDRSSALSLLFERLVEGHDRRVSASAVEAVEQEVVTAAFAGNRGAYLAALAHAHVSVAAARAALADEIRRAELEAQQDSPTPTRAGISRFYAAYPQLPVRLVRVSPQASWLGSAREGYAVTGTAPVSVFALPRSRSSRIQTLLGTYKVRPAGPTVALGSLPLGKARAAIAISLESFARARSFDRWTIAEQGRLLDTTICRADDLPEPASTELAQYVPFLAAQ